MKSISVMALPTGADAPSAIMARVSGRGAALLGAVLFIICLAAALSVDVVKTGFGLKGDEATYVRRRSAPRSITISPTSAAISSASTACTAPDRTESSSRRASVSACSSTRSRRSSTSRRPTTSAGDRLYFGKALLYRRPGRAIRAAARPERVLGVSRRAAVLGRRRVLATRFSRCGRSPASALVFTTAFIGASCRAGVHGVHGAGDSSISRWSSSRTSSGCTRKSRRPSAGFLPASRDRFRGGAAARRRRSIRSLPPACSSRRSCCWAWSQRQYRARPGRRRDLRRDRGAAVHRHRAEHGRVQLSGRRSQDVLRRRFPSTARRPIAWTSRRTVTTSHERFRRRQRAPRISRIGSRTTSKYFLVGRHFGFVPYFFPGVVAILLWLLSRERLQPWRAADVSRPSPASAVVLLRGRCRSRGAGAAGRQATGIFMSLYAPLFFLTPPLMSTLPALLAWAGGALFTAKMLVNPFVAAKFPYQTTERGFARRLPVELTMANDLPVMLVGPSARTPGYSRRAAVLPRRACVSAGAVDAARQRACGLPATAVPTSSSGASGRIDHLDDDRQFADPDGASPSPSAARASAR